MTSRIENAIARLEARNAKDACDIYANAIDRLEAALEDGRDEDTVIAEEMFTAKKKLSLCGSNPTDMKDSCRFGLVIRYLRNA